MLAYEYPFLGLFWTMLWFFLWVAWIVLVVRVIGDIFRSSDLGGFAKAIWSLFVLFLPVIGVFCYLIARGGSMVERDVAQVNANEQAVQDYVRSVAGTSTTADQLATLADLRDRGVLSPAEFDQEKARLLA